MIQHTETKHDNALGICIISASVLTMAFADAVVKLVSADLTLWQIFITRSIFAVPIIVALVMMTGSGLKPREPKWAFLRACFLILSWISYYGSLPVLSLSVAAVAMYTNPIITVLLAATLLRERVTVRQWLGVLLGFAGVIVVLKPGTEAFSWFTLLPLLGALLYSLAMVLTRSKCQKETPLALALALHLSFIAAGVAATAMLAIVGLEASDKAVFPFLFGDWARMGAREWGWMALIGVLSAAYFVGVARAYQIATPSVVATFDYAYLPSAVLWGVVLFSDKPGLSTVCGMFLIAMAGLLVASRQRKK